MRHDAARRTAPAPIASPKSPRDLRCDIVVNVQGDEPLIEPRDDRGGDRARSLHDPTRADVHAAPADHRPGRLRNPNVVKVVVDRERRRAVLLALADSLLRATDGRLPSFKHIGLYAFRREFLLTFAALPQTPLERAESLEQLRALEHGFRIRTVETQYDSIGVDTPEDLERVRRRMSAAARA